MKPQSTKKLFAFIIAIMIISLIPETANAQKKCSKGHCPKGYACIDGYCVPNGGGGCNCFVRPIPFECGQMCGFLAGKTPANDLFSIFSDSHLSAIYFSLNKAEKISAKIFDMTGRLVKTFAEKDFMPGEHELLWNTARANAGIYMVQVNAGTHSEMKKISVIK